MVRRWFAIKPRGDSSCGNLRKLPRYGSCGEWRQSGICVRSLLPSIEIGRQQRPKLYDFFFEKDPALAPAEMRFGVQERTSSEGVVLRSPDEPALAALAGRIAVQRPQSIALSLLFSFANPANEQQVAAALGKLGLPLSISHQILPEFREYERASTVLVNAYLQPVMQTYLEKLRVRLSERGDEGNPSPIQDQRGSWPRF